MPCNSCRFRSRLDSVSRIVHHPKAPSPSINLSRLSLSALQRTWQEGPGQRDLRLVLLLRIWSCGGPFECFRACLLGLCIYMHACSNSGFALGVGWCFDAYAYSGVIERAVRCWISGFPTSLRWSWTQLFSSFLSSSNFLALFCKRLNCSSTLGTEV